MRIKEQTHHRDICIKETGLHSRLLLNTPYILSSEYNWDDLCIQLNNQQENVALPREALS
jgi:hypothetical protein